MEGRTSRKRGHLTDKQKKYRRENELCMYCGDAEHKITECPRLSMKRTSVIDIANSGTPLSPKAIAPPIGATPKERDETSVDVGLLAMPRELRNKIYEELLHLDEFQVQQFQPWRKIDPKILAVCRQIYQEASEILYDKNGWVTVTALDWIMSFMARDKIGVYTGFPGHDQPVTRYENDRLSKSAILDIKLLTQFHSVEGLELVLRFNHRAKKSHQSRLLRCLGQARGLRRVDITGTEPTWAAVNTVLLMTHPYKRLEEILNTVSAYQTNSEHELKRGRTLAARNLAQEGVDFVDWWLDEIHARRAAELEPNEGKEMDDLLQARADMGFSCASLSLRLGGTDLAQLEIERVLERLSWNHQICDTHRACAHYYMAQTFEAVGWKNAALYSYLQALRLEPGHQDAEVAVDQLERNLQSGPALEDANVKHNITQVVNPFRNQTGRSAVVSKRYYKTIFQEFAGTAAEIRSLDRVASGETDLIYMDPNYRGYGHDDDEDNGDW